MKKLAIISSGGFAREVLTIINAINLQSPKYEFVGYIDNDAPVGTIIGNNKVIASDNEIFKIQEDIFLVNAIGDSQLRKKVTENYINQNRGHLFFPSIIHPSVILQDIESTKIGDGVIICAGCILTTNIVIGDFVVFNLSCTVGHDTNILPYSSFMPSVNISGEVNIGEAVYVGTGAKIINMLSIGSNSVIGAGAVVINNIPNDSTAVGVPAKVIKNNI